MKTIGLIISHKNGEKRRALLPQDIKANVNNPKQLYFEEGYGESVHVKDKEYADLGCNIVSREEALECDVICDVKLGDAEFLSGIAPNKILFGWAHAVQNIGFTNDVLINNHTVIAWEEMLEGGRYIFHRNREVAGEAAIMHAYRYCGKMPYDTSVAILGNGQTAKGALRILHGLGATVDVYGRKFEKLFRERMFDYDVLVNCVLWDTSRQDRIIYSEDLKRMKEGTLIIDISCDPNLEIETSRPSTIDNPVYVVDGVIHYTVDNTPGMFPITITKVLSEGISRYIDIIITDDIDQYPANLMDAVVIKDGSIRDARITDFRLARNAFCK
jgi:N5-(carboxyethyl)ornithine synthase